MYTAGPNSLYAMNQQSQSDELKFDTGNLFRVEVFTDQRSGTIRRLTPVDEQGNSDPARPVRYIGEASAMTPAGTLPLSFELSGNSLSEAAQGFAEGAEQAFRETHRGAATDAARAAKSDHGARPGRQFRYAAGWYARWRAQAIVPPASPDYSSTTCCERRSTYRGISAPSRRPHMDSPG